MKNWTETPLQTKTMSAALSICSERVKIYIERDLKLIFRVVTNKMMTLIYPPMDEG